MFADRSLSFRAARPLDAGHGDVVVVRAAVAPLNGEARVSSSQVSQATAGHALLVLQREGEWLRVRGGDDYEGWVHAGYVAPSGEALGERGREWYREAPLSLDCTVRGPAGARRLPVGAILLPGEERVAGETIAPAALADRFPAARDTVAATAATLFQGTSYQWGGVTPWGCDCSGFVQTVSALHGLPLPRDAWQQALEGSETAAGPTELDAGDLLFFSDRADGRITHVGMSLGDGRMAHVALGRGGFAVDRLDATGDPYVARLLDTYHLARRMDWPR
ncbi:MAG TPA: SH3 domain-containing C40 family peptidase [Gemmatimonadaceae bacterium]|nr:SH3 domain-containing C40 family peptidase [Gemmatimonadaceae bacterium]